MRNLVEAIAQGQSTYWFDSRTRRVIPCSDHGDAVERNPDTFGVEWDIVQEMEEAWPYGSEDDEEGDFETPEERDAFIDGLPPPPSECGPRSGNDRNNCWEQLAMNRGWVRVGHSVGFRGGTAAYFSSSDPKAIWRAVSFAHLNGGIGPKGVELELCPVGGTGGGFVALADDDLETYLKYGLHRNPFPEARLNESHGNLRIRITGEHIVASLDGRDVGWFRIDRRLPGKVSLHANLDASVRRQGIATRVYDWAQEHFAMMGLSLVPFFRLSDEAYEFWKRRDPEAVADFQRVQGRFSTVWYSPYGMQQGAGEIAEILKEWDR